MPTVTDNKQAWDGDYQWTHRGDEWSAAWGGPQMQWYGTILPRIHRFVPTGNILEIACGFGRWTQFLKEACNNLAALELSQECLDACKQRFAESTNIEYHLNDGKSLEMLSDASIDFIFSFDSLVHVDESTLQSYMSQFPRILKDNGAVFIHHSNLGEYHSRFEKIRKIPLLEGLLKSLGYMETNLHWRDPGVSTKVVARMAKKAGLQCISQEIVPWGTKKAHIDCFSTIVQVGSSLDGKNRIYRNASFMKEAQNLLRLSRLHKKKKKDV
jgi:SAM-dependent methyltransferase